MSKLILHCGADTASLQDVKDVQLPNEHPLYREASSYRTLPHGVFINHAKNLIHSFIGEDAIKSEAYALGGTKAYPGARMFAMIRLELPSAIEVNAAPEVVDGFVEEGDQKWKTVEDDGLSPTLFFRNSYDRSMSASMAMGYQVWACDNLAVSGELAYSRKHTKNILKDVIGTLSIIMQTFGNQHQFDLKCRQAMKEIELDDDEAYKVLGLLIGRGVLSPTYGNESQIQMALEQWRSPNFDCFKERNLWSLYNAVTFALRKTGIKKRLEVGRGANDAVLDLLHPEYAEEAKVIRRDFQEAL